MTQPDHTTTTASPTASEPRATRLEVRIEAPPARVWAVLAELFHTWWPESFNATGPGASVRLELFPGGRVVEERDGGGLLWGTVVNVRRNEQLQILGDSFPQWGGPFRAYMTYTLTPSAGGDATTVRYEEERLGRVSDKTADSLDHGWAFLLQCLKAKVEGRPAPIWTE